MKAHGSVSRYLSIRDDGNGSAILSTLVARSNRKYVSGKITKNSVLKLKTANDNSCKLEPVENHQTGTHNFQD